MGTSRAVLTALGKIIGNRHGIRLRRKEPPTENGGDQFRRVLIPHESRSQVFPSERNTPKLAATCPNGRGERLEGPYRAVPSLDDWLAATSRRTRERTG